MMIKNIESKIRLAGLLAFGSLMCAFSISAFVSFFAYKQVVNARKSIYILSGNTPIAASQVDVGLNRAVEYRADIAKFHDLFFSLVPDDKFIEHQMKQAMYLVDESGMSQYQSLKENGFFSAVLSSSAIVTLHTDSIILDESRKYFKFYGTQQIDRRSSRLIRSVITEGYLQDLQQRTENNPHAVLITKWKTIENKDLENVAKNSF